MDIYYALKVESTDEVILALLLAFDFESFEENESDMIGYIHEEVLTPGVKIDIEQLLNEKGLAYSFEKIMPQNWNEIWENAFQPVIVENFCQVRADFHPPASGIQHDIIINPKMAFGTGHHATTYMMMAQMAQLNFEGTSVFDFGCGTGILAILASKLGATTIEAVDIERESYHNTVENAAINQVDNIHVFCGDLDVVPEQKYDVILANINRNILTKYAVDLNRRLQNSGKLLISGVLDEDEMTVVAAFEAVGMVVKQIDKKEGWISVLFQV